MSLLRTPNLSCVKHVATREELLAVRFADGVNAACYKRTLDGDFAEVVAKLAAGEGITNLDEARLLGLDLSAAGRAAVAVMIADLQWLRERGLAPELNCIRSYPRDEEPEVIATDVYSYHADSAPVEADTWLCTYYGASSEALRPEDAVRKVDDPNLRAELLKIFGGEEGEEFKEFLQECCYDLHYAPKVGAEPYSFGLGNLWRITTAWPGSRVPPCVHRAPENRVGDSPRLLLIS